MDKISDEVPVFGAAPDGVDCRKRPAAYAVIVGEAGRAAVVRVPDEMDGRFCLPGGGIEDAESPEDAVRREIREELGREVILGTRIGQAVQFFYVERERCWYEMFATFLRADLSGEKQWESEYELEWLDVARESGALFHECHVWAVRKVLTREDGQL